MSYSRAIEGRQDAQVLAALFKRLRLDLALVRDAQGVTTVGSFNPARADIKPEGQVCTSRKAGQTFTTASRGCVALPSRTKARVGEFEGNGPDQRPPEQSQDNER